jgi:hypothetical protein
MHETAHNRETRLRLTNPRNSRSHDFVSDPPKGEHPNNKVLRLLQTAPKGVSKKHFFKRLKER